MSEHSDSATLAYIRHVLSEMQISPSALARLAGISPTTLTRPLNNNNYKFNISATTIEKIATVSGIGAGAFFSNSDYASVALASIHDPSAYNPEMWGSVEPPSGTLLIGAAGLGLWQEVGKAHADMVYSFSLVSTDHKAKDCFAVVAADGHAGNVAYMGDHLFCVRYAAWGHELVSSRMVLLERRRDNGRLMELTARRLQKVNAGWQLNTPGRGRLMQDQVTLPELPGDGDCKVIGVVVYGIRDASMN